MTEIFQNIREEVKQTADTAWQLALAQRNPVTAANFLYEVLKYYENIYTDEEMDFLQFYFNMKMEMIKNDNASSER